MAHHFGQLWLRNSMPQVSWLYHNPKPFQMIRTVWQRTHVCGPRIATESSEEAVQALAPTRVWLPSTWRTPIRYDAPRAPPADVDTTTLLCHAASQHCSSCGPHRWRGRQPVCSYPPLVGSKQRRPPARSWPYACRLRGSTGQTRDLQTYTWSDRIIYGGSHWRGTRPLSCRFHLLFWPLFSLGDEDKRGRYFLIDSC